MDSILIATILVTVVAVPAIALTVWFTWPGFMGHMITDMFRMHEHMEDHDESAEANEAILTGVIIDKNSGGITVWDKNSGRDYIVLVEGSWIIEYDGGKKDVIYGDEVLAKYIKLNNTIVVIGYSRGSNIIYPKEILLTNKGLSMKSMEFMEEETIKGHCPMR